jgi:hypothetical protein
MRFGGQLTCRFCLHMQAGTARTRASWSSRDLLSEGDFRDWSEMEEWVKAIAAELAEIGRQTDDPQQ